MSQPSARAAAARENARQSDGKFGSYHLPDAGTDADLGFGNNPDHPSWDAKWSPDEKYSPSIEDNQRREDIIEGDVRQIVDSEGAVWNRVEDEDLWREARSGAECRLEEIEENCGVCEQTPEDRARVAAEAKMLPPERLHAAQEQTSRIGARLGQHVIQSDGVTRVIDTAHGVFYVGDGSDPNETGWVHGDVFDNVHVSGLDEAADDQQVIDWINDQIKNHGDPYIGSDSQG